MKNKPSHALIGIAGVHFVVAELSRRGMVALPTVRNTAGYDIVVSNVKGTRYATIQVKTSLRRVPFFPMPPSQKVNQHKSAFYALVRRVDKEDKYECFLLTGAEAKLGVRHSERVQAKRIEQGMRKKFFPSITVGTRVSTKAEKWKRRWLVWSV